jgi:beta-lactamase regulating signal transducer with metallopeptidase domain
VVELAELLIRANLAAGAAILIVAALRKPARDLFGAEVAYGLWLVPLAAALASLAPARTLIVPAGGEAPLAPDPVAALLAAYGHSEALVAAWAVGLLLMAAMLTWSQTRFLQRARHGLAGPAVVGVIWPKFVTPSDYEDRFTAEERRIIRAHERMHLDRGDLRPNALIAALQTVFWFNPLIHWAAKMARHDQELACDAAVMSRMPGMRRRYAETLLKTQLSPPPLPLGCYWWARGLHPLEERIGQLRQASPAVHRYLAGSLAVVVLTALAAGGAWAVKPAHLAVLPAPQPARAEAVQPTMSFKLYRDGWPGV